MDNNKIIKNVRICFENCETYLIPSDSIKLDIGELSTSTVNNTNNYNHAKSITMVINNLSNIKPFYEWSDPFSKRIKRYDDVCLITIEYDDESEFKVYVPWNHDDDQYNSYQKTKIDSVSGELTVDIRKRRCK